jgi:hypothetical protein
MGAPRNQGNDTPPLHTLFVSTAGNDDWNGTAAAPVAGGTDGPKASVQGALAELRKWAENGNGGRADIVLRGGYYFLDSPLAITADNLPESVDSLTIKAYGDEVPVLSGGRRITDWKTGTLNGRTVWTASLPDVKAGKWTFHQFFVNGRRCPRPRLPREGLYQVQGLPDVTPETKYNEGQTRFVCRKGDIQPWHNLTDVEIVSLNYWIDSRMWIRDFDAGTCTVTMDRKSDKRMTDDYVPGALGYYYVENVFEALRDPGEWYLDRTEGVLTYLPRPGETPDSVVAIAPVLETLVQLKGTAESPLKHIVFDGIQFSHNEYKRPPDKAAFGQSASSISTAVTLEHCHGCVFTNCAVTQVGTYALGLEEGCMDCAVRRSELSDLGAGGIRIWHDTKRNTVADCVIADGGHRFLCGVGILIGQSSANNIVHNHIHHLYYSGISVGWTWGYGPSNAFGNVIEYNHIHDIGQGMLSDMGGIYTLGISTGTRIRFNLFHDIQSRGYGGWAIYTDEGSTDILIEKNIAYRTKSAVFHQHYGRDNLIQNNILAFGTEAQIARTRIEDHCSIAFRRNIVLFDRGALLSGNWATVNADFDRNLYWDMSGRDLAFAGRTLSQWQRLGYDRNSIVADPRFADPENGDFRLLAGSPAGAIGFEPFSLETVGPRPAACTEQCGTR